MESKLKELAEKLKRILEEKDLIVCSVNYKTKGKYNFLVIEIDKVNGLDIDTIVEATNIINPIVDEINITSDNYILDVISKERG